MDRRWTKRCLIVMDNDEVDVWMAKDVREPWVRGDQGLEL